jgi:hypothetical protein
MKGIAGEGGLLVADELLLPELLFSKFSIAPSAWVLAWDGVVPVGETFPEAVPN